MTRQAKAKSARLSLACRGSLLVFLWAQGERGGTAERCRATSALIT